MVFPQSGTPDPRHPSQLYHFGLEGLMLFLILWLWTAKPRPSGAASGLFLIGYGSLRFITEFFREPDHGIFGQSYAISMGQWLSLPMILIGIGLMVLAYRRKAL
jgi:phosphatidylglycerol:prolipoprotein diacylglycerol transferase